MAHSRGTIFNRFPGAGDSLKRASPLVENLAALFVHQNGKLIDLVSGRSYTPTGVFTSQVVSGLPGFRHDGASSTYFDVSDNAKALCNGDCTVVVGGAFDSGGASQVIFSATAGAANSGVVFKSVQYPNTASIGVTSPGVVDWNSGIPTPVGPAVIVFTANASTATIRTRDNYASSALAKGAGSDAATIGAFKKNGAYQDQLLADDTVGFIAVYDRVLSEGDQVAWIKNPRVAVRNSFEHMLYWNSAQTAVAGGTIFLVSVTDGMFMDDGTVKGRDSVQADPVFLNDNFNELVHDLLFQDQVLNAELMQRITELQQTDYPFLNDAFTEILRELIYKDSPFLASTSFSDLNKLVVDSTLLASTSFSALDKLIMDYVLLADTVLKLTELNLLDSLFLYDSATQDITRAGSQLFTVLITDYLLLLSEIVKTQEATNAESLFLADAALRELIKELTDTVLLSEEQTRTTELNYQTGLYLAEVVTRVRELVALEGIYLGEVTSAQLSVAGAAALVYARLLTKDLLGISAGADGTFLGISAGVDGNFLGITAGSIQANNEGGP